MEFLQVIKEKHITTIPDSKRDLAKATVIGRDCLSITAHGLRTIELKHLQIAIALCQNIYLFSQSNCQRRSFLHVDYMAWIATKWSS